MVGSFSAITLNMQSFFPNLRFWEVCKVQLLGSHLNNKLGFEAFFWVFFVFIHEDEILSII
jgi:hypothetical protein